MVLFGKVADITDPKLDGRFEIEMVFDANYDYVVPKVRFLTIPFHPLSNSIRSGLFSSYEYWRDIPGSITRLEAWNSLRFSSDSNPTYSE
jgi:hypothetical protein